MREREGWWRRFWESGELTSGSQGNVVRTAQHLHVTCVAAILTDSPPTLADTPPGLKCVCVTAGHMHETMSTGFNGQSATSDGRSHGVSDRLTDYA
jgi:hypothetical protein